MIRAAQNSQSDSTISEAAFDALLVGCCGVETWAQPLARKLPPDLRRRVDSYLRPRISRRAAHLLRAAGEVVLIRVFRGALRVAVVRHGRCVWPSDIEVALMLTGNDRLCGIARPPPTGAGCVECPGLVRVPHTRPPLRRLEDYGIPPEALTAPTVSAFRREARWCEAAKSGTWQAAVHRSMRLLAYRGGITHLAPGTLNAACSALVGYLNTALAHARGESTPLLDDIREQDARLDALRERVHAMGLTLSECDAGADEETSSCTTEESDSDAYSWIEEIVESPQHFGGLTEDVVAKSLRFLGTPVYIDKPDPCEANVLYDCGDDVVARIRSGELNLADFVEGESDAAATGTSALDTHIESLNYGYGMDRREDLDDESRAGAVASCCPGCGSCCVIQAVHYRGRDINVVYVNSVRRRLDLDIAAALAGHRWDGIFSLDGPDIDPSELAVHSALSFGPRGGEGLRTHLARRLLEAAARRAGISCWLPGVEPLVALLIGDWMEEFRDRAEAFHCYAMGRQPEVWMGTGVWTFEPWSEGQGMNVTVADALRVIVSLIDGNTRGSQTTQPVYLLAGDDGGDPISGWGSFVASSLDRGTLLPAEWPSKREVPGVGWVERCDVDTRGNYSPGVRPQINIRDVGANEIVSRWLAIRLSYLLFRARPICPRTTRGLLLTADVLRVMTVMVSVS